MIKLSG